MMWVSQGGVESMEITRIIPDDILEEILVRLPVKSLLRWKCVSKHCYALVVDFHFTIKHYRFQYALHLAYHGTLPLLLDKPISYPTPEDEPTQFFILSKQGADDILSNVTPDFHRDIPPGFAFANDSQLKITFRCMGIVNGVIGLQWRDTCLALWNPATREFKELPRWPIMPDNKIAEQFCGRILGLGFDLHSQDLKILGVIDYCGDGIKPKVYEFHLYSLKTNSWKKLKEAPRSQVDFHWSHTDAYLNNGVYYWYAHDKAYMGHVGRVTSLIVAFNFNTETFAESELPKGGICYNKEHIGIRDGRVYYNCKMLLTLGKYKETLALFVCDTVENSDCYVEVWGVSRFREDNHEVPLSWQLVVRVSPLPYFLGLYVNKFRECGDLLLLMKRGNSHEDEEGCLYDTTKHTFNNLGVGFSSSFTYVDSLFPLTRVRNLIDLNSLM